MKPLFATLLSYAIVITLLAPPGQVLSDGAEGSGHTRRNVVPPGLQTDSFADVIDVVRASVVNVIAIDGTPSGSKRRVRGEERNRGGSGIIIDSAGHVVTTDHVVDKARRLMIRLHDGTEYEAKLVGRDAWSDLAVMKIQAPGPFSPAVLAEVDKVRVGDWVLAIGSPFGLEQSVSAGIISAKGRVLGEGPDDDFLQTDASTNPGNSGGPLVNTRGEVVGIYNIGFGERGESVGVGLAIPVNLVKEIVPQLLNAGRVTRASLGIAITPVTPAAAKTFGRSTHDGALVAKVSPGGPGARSGLREGDLILAFEGQPIHRAHELVRLTARSPVGSEVVLTILRAGRTVSITARLVELRGSPRHDAASHRWPTVHRPGRNANERWTRQSFAP